MIECNKLISSSSNLGIMHDFESPMGNKPASVDPGVVIDVSAFMKKLASSHDEEVRPGSRLIFAVDLDT